MHGDAQRAAHVRGHVRQDDLHVALGVTDEGGAIMRNLCLEDRLLGAGEPVARAVYAKLASAAAEAGGDG